MTEKREYYRSATQTQFILFWGDMGSDWGVSQSVAQHQALLFSNSPPLIAEHISQRLGIVRSNVSNTFKELVVWKLIRSIPICGDRRKHFEAECDVLEIATRVTRGRKEREFDPAIPVLSDCVTAAWTENSLNAIALARMKEMREFLYVVDSWYDQMPGVSKSKLKKLMKTGNKVLSLLSITGKKSE